MAMNRSDSTWKLMQENHFEVLSKVNENMFCVICRKLIINASFGPCGCRYCMACITNYLHGNDKCCPGNSNDCPENSLNLRDIDRDNALNISILKLRVKCPQINCTFTAELRNIENHLRQCNLNATNCLSNSIGNNSSSINHVENEINYKSKILLESYDNLKNENELLKQDLMQVKNEVELNRNLNRDKINELETIVETNTLKIEELNEEMEAVKHDNRRLTEEVEHLKNNQEINKMNEIIARFELELNQLKQNWIIIDNKDGINTSYLRTNNSEITDYTHDEISGIIPFEEIHNPTISYVPFEWKIEDFSKNFKENAWKCSEPFFTHENGFKICLWVRNNISSLDSSLSFMQGEFDDDLSWPFEHGFTVQLVNSYSLTVYRSKTITYNGDLGNDGWQKPKDQYCHLISIHNNIRLNNSLINNDCLTIRCFVDL